MIGPCLMMSETCPRLDDSTADYNTLIEDALVSGKVSKEVQE